jgi:flagellar biosynthesis anti-sigma factor FlgM
MKIEEVYQKMSALLQNDGMDKTKTAERKSYSATYDATGDTVAISSTMRSLNMAMSFDEIQPVRTERTSILQSLIQSGEYNIDGRAVAQKMVDLVNRRA